MSRFLISGGGTGGHIFPAIAIANAIKNREEDAEILFVGAKGRMEMTRIPKAGYKIIGLNVSGFQRKFSLVNLFKNTLFPFRLIGSLFHAYWIVKSFKPDVVIGVGGFASGPTLKMAVLQKIPTLIQEQNSFPGVTNRMLAPKVNKICAAYQEVDKYFPPEKIIITGNPIRSDIRHINKKTNEAYEFFKLDPSKKTIAIIGGSLGSKTMNVSIEASLLKIKEQHLQLIWQTGEKYYSHFFEADQSLLNGTIKIMPFVERMDYLYSVADLIISRAGAISISELSCLEKPCILIPSPNVSGDHQTKNAMVLSNKKAAIMISDNDAIKQLGDVIIETINDENRMLELSKNISQFGYPDALENIVNEIYSLKKDNNK